MSLEVASTRMGILGIYRRVNDRVRRQVAGVSIKPFTRVSRLGDWFEIDLKTGSITAAPGYEDNEDVLAGYLAHENGHMSGFPVSPSVSVSFIAAVASRTGNPDPGAVKAACNVVADTFSDLLLTLAGMGGTLAGRVSDFASRTTPGDLAMTYKLLVYLAIRHASTDDLGKLRSLEAWEHWLRLAARELAGMGADPTLLAKAGELARRLVEETLQLPHVKILAKQLVGVEDRAPDLSFLVDIAVELLGYRCSCSGGGEGLDIVPRRLDADDLARAQTIGWMFGVNDSSVLAASIEKMFAGELRRLVEELVRKMMVIYSQNDYTTVTRSGYRKDRSVLWLRPWAEPDEDSMLIERSKLRWDVIYKRRVRRGATVSARAKVPDEVVVVVDESGSTYMPFGGSSVFAVENMLALLTVAGLRYRGGAKRISVIKFSDRVVEVYSGGDHVEAGAKLMVLSQVAGGGTEIVRAIKYALKRVSENAALVVVTDAEISEGEARHISAMLRSAVDQGRLGFVTFLVVNPSRIETIDVIRAGLEGKNAVVAHISGPEEATVVGQRIVSHVLKTYAPA